jgi:hypothetical protein
MFRKFAMVILLVAGTTGWRISSAQVTACDWDVGGTTCDGGGTFSLVGPPNYMVAHRTQRHSIVTSDGATHVIVNNGTTLQLYTSIDSGRDWTLYTVKNDGVDIFANTNDYSTSDIAIAPPGGSSGTCSSTDYMTVIFNDYSESQVEEACLSWNASTGWSLQNFFTALSSTLSPGTLYSMQSYVAENVGSGEYLAVVATGSVTTQIEVFYNHGTGYYTTGVSVPNPGNPNNCNGIETSPDCPAGTYFVEHAPRVVYLPRVGGDHLTQSVGLLYQAVDSSLNAELYWEVLVAGTAGGSPTSWTTTGGAVGPMPSVQADATNTGFSVATVVNDNSYDDEIPGTQYLAYLAVGTLGNTFIRTGAYIPGSAAGWGNFQQLPTSDGYTPSYVKLTYSAQDLST